MPARRAGVIAKGAGVARSRNRIGNPSAVQIVALDEAATRRRYRWLADYLMASMPDTPAAEIHRAMGAERDRLDATNSSIAHKLTELEGFLAGRGLLVAAGAFADRHCGSPQRTSIRQAGRYDH